MDIEEFLGWSLGEENHAFNIETGSIITIVSGFIPEVLEEYKALKNKKAKEKFLEEGNHGLWTRGFASQESSAHEMGSIGDIKYDTCKNWIALSKIEEYRNSQPEIFQAVRINILERRVSELELGMAKMARAFN